MPLYSTPCRLYNPPRETRLRRVAAKLVWSMEKLLVEWVRMSGWLVGSLGDSDGKLGVACGVDGWR